MSPLMPHPKPAGLLTGFVLAIVLAGCGGDGGGGAQTGSLSVSLTDAPACGFDAVNITVDRVRVHRSSSANENAAGWTTIALVPPRKINLLDLNDPTQPNLALEHLGVAPLEAGHYTQLRLVLVANSGGPPFANSVVLSAQPNSEIALDTPSAVQSGIKLIHQFTVNSGQRTDLLLDFDACKSVLKTGNNKYKLKPVIGIIPFELNGIQGFVETALLTSNVVVLAQQNGTVVRSTTPNASTGHFFLARLDAAMSYDVVISDGHATRVIAGVPVPTSTSTTIVSTQGTPIPLTTSPTQNVTGTVTLNPPSDDEAVFIAAKQTLDSGPTITVKSQSASVVSGNPPGDYEYGLTLPAAAPWLGLYSTPLPIVFTQQPPSVAGMYTVHSSAAGFGAKSSSVDISGGDQILNFTLP